MLEQLHGYTHEIINALSALKMFSAVLAIYFTVWGLIIIGLSIDLIHCSKAVDFRFFTYRFKLSYSLLSARTGSFLAA